MIKKKYKYFICMKNNQVNALTWLFDRATFFLDQLKRINFFSDYCNLHLKNNRDKSMGRSGKIHSVPRKFDSKSP